MPLLSGRGALRGDCRATTGDVTILNVALALEYEAINAYQLGASSGLLQKPVLDVAVRFQSDHKAHRDALAATIRKLGGTPLAETKLEDTAHSLKADMLKSQSDVLDLAARLELGATNAYLGVIRSDTQLAGWPKPAGSTDRTALRTQRPGPPVTRWSAILR